MKENVLVDKSFKFAVRIVKLYKYLSENKKEFILSKQILRSGTSIGANINEAQEAQSKNDFISKLSISLKEARETKYGVEEIKEYIAFGLSPRASIDLYKGSMAYAYLRGRDFVTPVDIAHLAKEVMRHRLILSYEAEAEGINSDDIIDKVISAVPMP